MPRNILKALLVSAASLALTAPLAAQDTQPLRQSWSADNGNGTYTNPLFYDEFSDPDMIRVGDDYYLTGTTMHSNPGLPVLHSKDLVNWEFLSYASESLDLGPAFRLEEGEVYGQGLWAPTFRHHDGTFYIFSNVNGEKTQKFTATDPAGPWTHEQMDGSFHDLSVLFDDDGTAYMVWGYQEIRVAELNDELTNIVPGTEQVILEPGSGLGEGIHFYKFGDTYFLISAEYRDSMRMPAARASSPFGPWEVIRAISEHEDFGLMKGRGIATSDIFLTDQEPPFELTPADPASRDRLSLHQGGVVQTPEGEWWGFSMYDANSIGRLTALSPITWKDGWPWFGLPGNLERTPRTWVKPATGPVQAPKAPYQRSDDFDAPDLIPVWQWNHVPVDSEWSLSARPGYLRLEANRADDLLTDTTTLTQRAIGPRSVPTVVLDTAGMEVGDRAGLALFNRPYGYLAAEKTADGLDIIRVDENNGGVTDRVSVDASRVWLRATADFMGEEAQFSFSTDGETFTDIGAMFPMTYQLYTFQGVRYSLFAFNPQGEGGYADFDSIDVHEPAPYGLAPIPYGREINLAVTMLESPPRNDMLALPFTVVDQGKGQVSLERDGKALTVGRNDVVKLVDIGREGQLFQWSETPTGEIVLMSLKSNRFLYVAPENGQLMADSPGPDPDGQDGVRFEWTLVTEAR